MPMEVLQCCCNALGLGSLTLFPTLVLLLSSYYCFRLLEDVYLMFFPLTQPINFYSHALLTKNGRKFQLKNEINPIFPTH